VEALQRRSYGTKDLLDQYFCTFNSPQALGNVARAFAGACYIEEGVVIPCRLDYTSFHFAWCYNFQLVGCIDSQNFEDSKSYWY
jgi:hypothetical protein